MLSLHGRGAGGWPHLPSFAAVQTPRLKRRHGLGSRSLVKGLGQVHATNPKARYDLVIPRPDAIVGGPSGKASRLAIDDDVSGFMIT